MECCKDEKADKSWGGGTHSEGMCKNGIRLFRHMDYAFFDKFLVLPLNAVYPFSFTEFQMANPALTFDQYLQYGGMPFLSSIHFEPEIRKNYLYGPEREGKRKAFRKMPYKIEQDKKRAIASVVSLPLPHAVAMAPKTE